MGGKKQKKGGKKKEKKGMKTGNSSMSLGANSDSDFEVVNSKSNISTADQEEKQQESIAGSSRELLGNDGSSPRDLLDGQQSAGPATDLGAAKNIIPRDDINDVPSTDMGPHAAPDSPKMKNQSSWEKHSESEASTSSRTTTSLLSKGVESVGFHSQNTTPARNQPNTVSRSITPTNRLSITPTKNTSKKGSKQQEISTTPSKEIPISNANAARKLFQDGEKSSFSSSFNRNLRGVEVGGRSLSRSPAAHAALSRSIPRKNSLNISPSHFSKMAATPSSVFMNSLHSNDEQHRIILDHQEVTDIVSEHLVQPSDVSDLPNTGTSFGSMAHSLKGGSITRDIYKWQENREIQEGMRPRSNSNPEIFSGIIQSPSLPSVAALREPGGFRRHFIAYKAKKEGKKPPNFLTSNFIDFLILYGFYGGDVYPSDDEDDEEDEESRFGRLPSGGPISAGIPGPSTAINDAEHTSENTPLLRRTVAPTTNEHGTSESKAFFMLVKAFVGTGVLFLPQAFSNGGLVFSLIAMAFIGYLTKHCMILLVETSRAFGNKSFGDLGQIIYGDWCKTLVLGSIAVSQMGFSCAYFIFVGQNLRDLLMIVSDCRYILPDWVFIVVQLALYIPLAWVRKIKNFGITSLIADVFILAGLGYIFVYDLYLIGQKGVESVPWMNSEKFPLFIGTAMFAFEGICLMLPIAESMKEPAKFNRVLDWGMLFIGGVFISIGALGYLALGNQVETIVFLNLPKRPEVTIIQFFYAIAIMLSFPLCVYPAIRITEQAIFGHSTGKRSFTVKWQKNLYRTALTALLGLVAWAGSSSLDKVVSLVGCFACIPLSFIYPAIFHSHITNNKWVKLKDWAIVVFGTLAMFYTTYITVLQWAQDHASPTNRCQSPP